MSWTVEVYVRDQADESLKAAFSNHAQGGAAIHELEYKLSRIGGCCELELVASRDRAQGHTVAVGNLIEVYVESDDEARDRKYRGLILSVDEDYVKDTVTIKAWGFWAQFEAAAMILYLEDTDVESAVDDIFDDVKAQTYCETTGSTSLVSSASLGDIEFDLQTAADAIKKLAEFQEDVDYGVDEDGTFFFQDKTTTKRGHFQVGLNVAELKTSETMEDLYNDVLIRTRGVVSNGSLTLHEDDSTSITSYKKRTKVLDGPEFHDTDNAITWAEARVAENKDPLKSYDFNPLLSEQKHFPYRGQVELVDREGTSLTTADIESVEYSFKEGEGFTQKLTVGDSRANWDTGRMFAEVERTAKILKASEMSSTKIEHSGFDEFAQYVNKNAMMAGKYNILVNDVSGEGSGKVRLIETMTGARLFKRRSTNQISGGIRGERMETEAAIVQTVAIPTGKKVDSVRLYYHNDPWGRYSFGDEDSLQDWYNSNCGDTSIGGYIVDQATGHLIGNPDLNSGAGARGYLWLRPMNWSREWTSGDTNREYWHQGDQGRVRFTLLNMSGSVGDIPFRCYFNYNSVNNNFCKFYAEFIAGSKIRWHLEEFTAGNLSSSDTGDLDDDEDYAIIFWIEDNNTTCKAILYYLGNASIQDTLSVTMAAQTNKRLYITKLANSASADTCDAEMSWFDFPVDRTDTTDATDRITYKVSRDGGTTWTSTTPAYIRGWGYVDLDISAQPAGDNTLILKAELDWPALLYGYGLAWGGD